MKRCPDCGRKRPNVSFGVALPDDVARRLGKSHAEVCMDCAMRYDAGQYATGRRAPRFHPMYTDVDIRDQDGKPLTLDDVSRTIKRRLREST